jgi:DNA transposition AAA+ family ATPase
MDEQKLERIVELKKLRDEATEELATLLGGGEVKQKRKWTRKQQPEEIPNPL